MSSSAGNNLGSLPTEISLQPQFLSILHSPILNACVAKWTLIVPDGTDIALCFN